MSCNYKFSYSNLLCYHTILGFKPLPSSLNVAYLDVFTVQMYSTAIIQTFHKDILQTSIFLRILYQLYILGIYCGLSLRSFTRHFFWCVLLCIFILTDVMTNCVGGFIQSFYLKQN